MKKLVFLIVNLLCVFMVFSQEDVLEGEILASWDTTDIMIPPAAGNLRYNDIWGITLAGNEYAVLGSSQGTHFIDVTDPSKDLNQLDYVAGANQYFAIHRDYHDYQCYLYAVCDEGPSTLQIMDISTLPDSVSVVYDTNELFTTVHNIFIDSMNARLYAFSVNGMPNVGRAGVAIYSLENPTNPTLLGHYSDFGGIQTVGVHDGYIRDNIAYLNCGRKGFAIVDYTDPENPIALGTLTEYEDQGYNHSGWLSDDGSHYYLGDETPGTRVKSIDVSDPTDIKVDTLFDAGSENPKSITHNQIVACDYLYISYYGDGLQVYDISEPASPKRIMFSNSFVQSEGIWGVFPFFPSNNIIVSDMETGLYVIKGFDDDCNSKKPTDCSVILSANDFNNSISQFSVYPNPIQSSVEIKVSIDNSLQKNATLSIVDVHGNIVFSEEKILNKENIWNQNLDFLANGFYILKINGQNLSISEKIILIH